MQKLVQIRHLPIPTENRLRLSQNKNTYTGNRWMNRRRHKQNKRGSRISSQSEILDIYYANTKSKRGNNIFGEIGWLPMRLRQSKKMCNPESPIRGQSNL